MKVILARNSPTTFLVVTLSFVMLTFHVWSLHSVRFSCESFHGFFWGLLLCCIFDILATDGYDFNMAPALFYAIPDCYFEFNLVLLPLSFMYEWWVLRHRGFAQYLLAVKHGSCCAHMYTDLKSFCRMPRNGFPSFCLNVNTVFLCAFLLCFWAFRFFLKWMLTRLSVCALQFLGKVLKTSCFFLFLNIVCAEDTGKDHHSVRLLNLLLQS